MIFKAITSYEYAYNPRDNTGAYKWSDFANKKLKKQVAYEFCAI